MSTKNLLQTYMNSKAEISLILIFLTIFRSVSAFTFEDSGQEGVTFGDVTTSGAQQIFIDENNEKANKEEQVQAVFIKDAQSEPTAKVLAGEENRLNNKFTKLSDGRYAFLVNILNYEVLPESSKLFLIQISDSKDQKTLAISINNLDDESPTLSTSSCHMEENKAITLENTECIFTIEDPDGILNGMDFSNIIDTGKGESKLFQLGYKEPIKSNQTKKADVYLTLKDGQLLDYEKFTLYTFQVAVKDGAGHSTIPENVLTIVQVDDIPDMPPVWDTFTSAKRITEESNDTIQVSAKDGDYGLNKKINYKIVIGNDTINQFIKIDQESGLITINEIDRDIGYDSIEFDVVAYEVEDEASQIQDSVTLMIDDIDDNPPLIHITNSDEKELNLNVKERADSINVDVYVEDIDQGENAMYNVKLVADGSDYGSAFQIIPSKGYEKTTLSLTITDPLKLDFENDDWKVIKFSIQTTGTKNDQYTDTLPVTITLEDINDEYPVFDQKQLTVTIPENVTKGDVVATVKATDKDAEDIKNGVKHEILGTLGKSLSIEEFGGEIKALADNVFNYEKQTEVYVQIRATDNAGHTTTEQLTIHVTDINDETPRLVVTSAISVEENQKDKTVLKTSISATDEDQTPDLEFSIDWLKSHATKNSQRLKNEDFEKIHCINAEVDKDTSDIHTVMAKLSIIETQKNNTPDFEIFDTLFITLVVTDKNQTEGVNFDSTTVVINIENINDNIPAFLPDTESKSRLLSEYAAKGSLVDVITAVDDDNLLNLNYSITSTDPDTSDWLTIDRENGKLTVNVENNIIDCDNPVRWNITYTVTATDGEHETPIDITIQIVDENDNSPTLEGETKNINEDNALSDKTQDGDVLFTLQPKDGDRDSPYNDVECVFLSGTTSDVRSRFKVEDLTIKVALTNGATLDREDIPRFEFSLNCYDNPSGSKSNPVTPPPTFIVILEDVNDNKPVITFKDKISINENTAKGSLSAVITAEDKDDGVNSEISFSITKIQRYLNEDCTGDSIEADKDLFTISSDDTKKNAILSVAKSLKDLYECLKLTVTATDGGGLSTDDNEIKVGVRKFNFEEPMFYFPKDGDTLYLNPTQSIANPLIQYNGEVLDHLNATDQQGGKYIIKYKVVSDSSDKNLFVASNNDLQITDSNFNSKLDYTVTIMAYLDVKDTPTEGEKSYNVNSTVKIKFFSSDTDPEFSSQVHDGVSTTFDENDKDASFDLPEMATYPNISLPDLKVYYLLKEGDGDIFSVDPLSGKITLKLPLDYETHSEPYSLVIVASNSESLKPDSKIKESSKLKVTINVGDQNDMWPVFEMDKYYATIVAGSQSNAPVIKVVAHDADSVSKLEYTITDIKASDSSSTDNKFEVSSEGQITSIFLVTDEMKGVYYTLTVKVNDEDETHIDETTVIVYIVTTINTVNFKFGNTLEVVRSKTDQIKQVVDKEFSYESQVEQPKSDTSKSDGTITIAPIYFIDSKGNVPLEGTVILRKVTDVSEFNKLKSLFSDVGLQLLNFQTEAGADENLQEILKAWLIGVSVVLGSLCVVLLVAFILKTRALKQRIRNLSNTKFGSQESGLNRTGVTAPTTNKHAVEGSNPVYNEATTKNIDTISVTSGDSDLIGVEDDEKFDYEHPEKEEKSRF